MTLGQRQIVLVRIPFTDLTAAKRRPALVLSSSLHNQSSPDVLVASITSNLDHPAPGVNISDDDLEAGSLVRDSRVLSGKLYTLSEDIIERVLGRLDQAAFDVVLQKLDDVLGRDNDDG